ncbi:MAG: hypothetical protein JSU79_02395 [Dehalococcoidales bacterium]|nr:MAG: hypothetical protein JSU79_02395 [Dehalococcoidales bacterium]
MRKHKQKTILFVLSAVIITLVVYCVGDRILSFTYCLPRENTTIKTSQVQIPTVEARLVETHTVEYVEEIVVEKEYVDVIRHVPVEFRNFTNRTELEQWLEKRNQLTSIRFKHKDTVIDCDDFAFELQQKALADGFIISFEIIGSGEYNELFSTQLPEGQALHAINLSIIGNDVYYIEPQTGEIVYAAYLD